MAPNRRIQPIKSRAALHTSGVGWLIAAVLAFSGACTGHTDTQAADSAAVEAAVRRFFDHISDFDFVAIEGSVTSDFELVEAGRRMDLAAFEAFLRTMETRGRRFAFELSGFNTEIAGDVAYTSYRNRDPAQDLEWLETVILRRDDGRWLIDRGQSLPVRRPGS